jgi:hypothetical protein
MLPNKPLRILLLQAESRYWAAARSYPYYLNFAFEESLRAAGVEVLMVTSPWFAQLPNLCAGQSFDQVWLNDLSHFADYEISLDGVANLAPIRIGFVTESFAYHPEEYAAFPWLWKRQARIDAQFAPVTHVVAVDEVDVIGLQKQFKVPTMWLPCSMPKRFIQQAPPPSQTIAFFSGSLYGERARWLETPQLTGLLARHQAVAEDRWYGLWFDMLLGHRSVLKYPVQQQHISVASLYPLYLGLLRRIRRSAFRMWQQTVLQQGAAVVNLPHLVKGYSGRVIEGMAAGRPVISWRIPDRPRNTALFEDGKEILLYETPEELASQIERVLADPVFAQQIVENARRKIKAHHTTEQRVRQILDWVAGGNAPTYGIPEGDVIRRDVLRGDVLRGDVAHARAQTG